ncbi:tRNA (adenosine(37)-N6)-threonylcarbamoyltransferase complex dimerization subunit type 1 TsaB [Bifidobacterium pseudolongum]|uniref:tRNA (adenosine(37)-N6)-threonylcarbamoyltransferase complex dimerization subunit type 1 TsaB n=1 Tax=Bifidobacterium pseudolongum TaxID=1694 RepID=UPI001CE15468|nr:tRNA (adenosine(37)-N6)-threonylcarbamoyltransferase complex dimerization subunit type 1 TsaB [Bifidobacterium pseudolongum]UBY93767.1 tRNA (adenosine(37)-N6)-threonylcarbamoyltransferase complex dimerization subunit type 1 TsaB [Bifidobacterium pseudolongum]
MHTLVIDTAYGSTVGIVGHEPIQEHNSRTHVERLQVDIAAACTQAGITPHDLDRIIVGTGPAPFTGLRAGIVTAQAIAFATGAELLGQDDLEPCAAAMDAARRHNPRITTLLPAQAMAAIDSTSTCTPLTLALNDARRKQLYFALYSHTDGAPTAVIPMDIDYPEHIAIRVNHAIRDLQQHHPGTQYTIDIMGHGAHTYTQHWASLHNPGAIVNLTALDLGATGLALFAHLAENRTTAQPVEPLYLRRPDVSVPNPLKHVLNHAPATKDAA